MENQRRRWVVRFAVFSLFVVIFTVAVFCFSSSSQNSDSREKGWSSTLANASTEKKVKPRVGIQAGHWKNSELPDELYKLRDISTGASAGGYDEWEVCLKIAKGVTEILEQKGVQVDLLPSTVPEGYKADAFVSIHTDGNEDDSVSGFKVSESYWDSDGKAKELKMAVEETYQEKTGMVTDPNITSDMNEYYAFNYNRFQHAIAPKTPGVIVEIGFITNYKDRQIMTRSYGLVSQGIGRGIIQYLKDKKKLADGF